LDLQLSDGKLRHLERGLHHAAAHHPVILHRG
jgi:hypothetical protein